MDSKIAVSPPMRENVTPGHTLIQEIKDKWIAQDGLMRLDAADDREPFPGSTMRTVKNQNGLMFLAEVIQSLRDKGIDPFDDLRQEARFAIFNCQVAPGLFARNKGNDVFMDSHDNMLGIMLLCRIFGFYPTLYEILEHGERTGWVYDNLKTGSLAGYFTALRQGKDIAVYKIAAYRRPYLLEILWLIGSALVPGSDIRLLRMRMKIAESAAHTEAFFKSIHAALSLIYMARGGDKKYREVVMDYFKDPSHPMRRLWE